MKVKIINHSLLTLILFFTAAISLKSTAQTAGITRCEALGIPPDQCINVVSTAVPLLRATSDARSGAMGDVGIAISPDANALFWNNAKLAFIEDPVGVSISFSPWLRTLGITDIYLTNLSGYYKPDELQSISGSLRYFSFGNITFTDITGGTIIDYRPNEFYLDFGYSRKLSDVLSTGLTLKYVHSDLASITLSDGTDLKVGRAIAADISFYYTNYISLGSTDAKLSLGLVASNIGNKISYTDDNTDKDFLPTNLGIGAAIDFDFDQYNKFTLAYDINKLMAPTPQDDDSQRDLPAISGIFASFGDASFQEEMQEIMHSIGFEYWYDNIFALRAGYFHEHKLKGNRKYFTIGAGVKYNIFGLNISYLAPTTGQHHPLARTIRFSLNFDFNDLSS